MLDEICENEPFEPFRRWLDQAWQREPNAHAMILATTTSEGRPSARAVLLKGLDDRGFVFYTNLESRKGRELGANRQAAMVFHWAQLERQIRVEGRVSAVSDAEADAYFASRPRGSQIGAWASRQSRPMERPGDLDARVEEFEKKYANGPVPRPPHWSGFRLVPDVIEFWKGKASRLHERQLFTRDGDGWRVQLLYP